MNNVERALSALNSLNPYCPREEWVRIGMSAKSAGLEFEDFHQWSDKGKNYSGIKDCKGAWKSFSTDGAVTEATLFKLAFENGWQDPLRTSCKNINYSEIKSQAKVANESTNSNANVIWERCMPAPSNHPYILEKRGLTDGLRVYPDGEPRLIIQGINVAGYLAVPCWSVDRALQTIQFIPPKEGKKLNLTGSKFKDGYFAVGEITTNIYVCEGIGAAWACNATSEQMAVVCVGSGRMLTVAKTLRSQYPSARLILVPDRGKEVFAMKIAAEVICSWIELPQDKPENYDIGDFLQDYGYEELYLLLHRVKAPEMPLDIVFADKLPNYFEPPDELVEGILISGDGSILYGDSNSGKTFFVIDAACAVARGIAWMGRKTEPGLVVYLAAESPSSVQRRLQAYQKYHDVHVPNFAIVQNPIDLFNSEDDTNKIIRLIHILEAQYGQKVKMIIGDTLARMSAGANENAGQDMGLVVRRFDRIRNECSAHFLLIHHSGKTAASGARGWSGVRAAVDTEIEVTDSPLGRCAEITKQRDLNTKGQRIGFKLESITLGLTKWKSHATSCVVIPADAPSKVTSKRLSEVGGALTEYLRGCEKPMKKTELVKHLTDRYTPSAVYRELKKLVKVGQVTDYMGSINLVRINADTNQH